MTPKNGWFHEINHAFVLACCLLGEGHAGGKKLTVLLNFGKPISKKAWTKHTFYNTNCQKSGRNIHEKRIFRSQNVLKKYP